MEIGNLVTIVGSGHPLQGMRGKVIGRRGQRGPDDTWILVFVDQRMRSYLIPESMLRKDEDEGVLQPGGYV
ncbi:MAG: hypothetical protein QHH05_05915 [Syntrophomonadaceae bacterium]|jgi:hypothetical protein|nr:hypothetical protein [Syntrophomonadaceae bacterium]MDH7497964.1 hypothetical protein [Syntrophomonadaceae bacterium]